MTFLYQKSRCLIEAFSLHLKHLLLFLPTTMYEGSTNFNFNFSFESGREFSHVVISSFVLDTEKYEKELTEKGL